MKLTLRQLEKIIKEAIAFDMQIIKLRVLDFDDTIAHTGERVMLHTPAGHRMLSSDDYATYVPKEGEYYDETSFFEFDNVQKEKASPVDPVFKILRNFVEADEGQRIILILTARKQIVEKSVRDFLQYHNLDHSEIMFEGVGSSNPEEKVKVIEAYIDRYSANFVSFWDDSLKNVTAVKNYLDIKGIDNDVAHVKKDKGRIRLIRNFNIDMSIK